MKGKLLLVLLLFAGTSAFAGARFYFGVGVGGPAYYPGYFYTPPPPPPAVAYYPPAPGPGYNWIPGYYYPVGARYHWHRGYWARPPYAGAYWVGPRYYSHRYYRGYWRR